MNYFSLRTNVKELRIGENSSKGIDKEIKHLKSMGYHPSPTAFGRKPKKKKKRIKKK